MRRRTLLTAAPLAAAGAGVVGLTTHTKTLEEIFLSLTQTQEVK